MSKEIMRVSLSAKQVREACAYYVECRTQIPGDRAAVYSAGYDGDAIEVVVSEKRERKKKAAAA